jgi:hypothetical protein
MFHMSRRTCRGLLEAILVPMGLAGVMTVLLLLGRWFVQID